ncbi:MAG: hypothetical protein J5J00_00470 [Deltaproteobacteria bacterium]|nr:hypothetical protein [Deltaproteobacteria bacterium]
MSKLADLFMPCIAACVSVALLMASYGALRAEPRNPPLEIGIGHHDVIRLWGAPKEIEEQESKRREIWWYGKSQVTFHEGKVFSWYDDRSGAVMSGADNKKLALPRVGIQAPAAPGPDSAVVEEILSEIMKEPSSPESGEGAPPAAPLEMPQAEVIN